MDVRKSAAYIVKSTGTGDLDIYAGTQFHPTRDFYAISSDGTEECPVYASKSENFT